MPAAVCTFPRTCPGSRHAFRALPPGPPPSAHIWPLCCRRIYLARPASEGSEAVWLDDRGMECHNRSSRVWDPEWVCLRCNANLCTEHPLFQHLPPQPACETQRARTLAIDLPAAQRGWICCHTPSGTLHPCRPQAVPVESARPAEPPASGQHTALAASSWSTRGPRPGHRAPPPYSWFFVPLLHVAARSLHPDAIQQWEAHPFYGRLWADALSNLQLAPAVPVATLATAVQTLQDVYAREGRQLSAFEAALPAVLAALVEGLPAGTLAHLNWVLPRVRDTNGYVPASAQEALLENYLGSGPATALTAAFEESLRTSPESPLPAQVTSPRALSPCSPRCSDGSSSGSDDSTSSTSTVGP